MSGASTTQAKAKVPDSYVVAIADDGLKASTFADRVVTSPRASMTFAVLAGLGAFKAPLHGGPPGLVITV